MVASFKQAKKALMITAFFLITIMIGQLFGSYIFLDLNPQLTSFSVGILTLYDLYKLTQGTIASMGSYKFALFVAVITPLIIPLIWLMSKLRGNKRELHGSARFADFKDVQKAKLFYDKDAKDPTILVGKYQGKFLLFGGKQFVLLAAPTRSGKGVGVVIPNCLHYSDSLVVMDLKLENFQLTAAYRQASGQEVYLLNLSTQDLKSHGWNPLSYISRDPIFATAQAQRIASILYTASGNSNGTDRFFNEMAQKLFVGLCLYMIETEKQTNVPTTLAQLVKLTAPASMTLVEWINQVCDPSSDIKLSDSCINNLRSYANNSDNTASGILSSLLAPLSVFTDPIVSAITSREDIDLRQVRKKKMTIYVGVTPDDLGRFERILNLFFSQLLSENLQLLPEQTKHLPDDHPDKLRYQCLLLLDEFAAMGKMEVIEKGVAFIAGYNMRLLAIYQNNAQLAQLYNKEGLRTMVTNFECQITYPTKDNEDAKEYSDAIGYETFKSRSTSRGTGQLVSNSTSISDQRRALLLPQEIQNMPTTDCIVRLTGVPPIYAKKIIYYEDPVFTPRLMDWKAIKVPDLNINGVTPPSTTLTDEETQLMQKLSDVQILILESLSLMINVTTATDKEIMNFREAVIKGYGATGGKLFDIYRKKQGRVMSI